MAANASYEDVRRRLAQLRQEKDIELLSLLTERVEKSLDIEEKKFTPEEYLTFIEFVRAMRVEVVDHRRHLLEVMQEAKTGTFYNPNLDVQKMYQAHGDIIQFFVGNFEKDVRALAPEPILYVPVLLLVMTRAQADQLVSGDAFLGKPAEFTDDFRAVQRLLNRVNIDGWLLNYGPTPRAWRPFADTNDSVEAAVEDWLGRVRRQQKYRSRLVPNFVDLSTLNDMGNRETLKNLRRDGCIVIKDALSMRHPDIQLAFRRSLLDAFPNTLIVRTGPDHDVLKIDPPLFSIAETYRDTEFFKRLRFDDNRTCSESYQSWDVRQWFVEQTPKIIPAEEKTESSTPGQLNTSPR